MPRLLVAVFFISASVALSAQTPSAGKTCSVNVEPAATQADKLLRTRKYDDALAAYKADVASAATPEAKSHAVAGVIQTLVLARRMPEALQEASKAAEAYPHDAIVLEAVGSARYRHGETLEAAKTWNAAMKANPCSARLHYDMARYLRLNGMHASEQRQLDIAHKLSPKNQTVKLAMARSTAGEPKYDQILERLNKRLEDGNLSATERAALQRSIDVVNARSKGSCELVHPVPSTKIPMFALSDGPGKIFGAGVTIELNGKKKRFLIDSGASGLLISKSAAVSAGLISEAEVKTGGVGDQGLAKSNLAHVEKVRVGNMEFQNCLVRYFDKKEALDSVDGLIGPDVFSNYLVSFDFPAREMRLGPLPQRPGDSSEDAAVKGLETAGGDANSNFTPRDRYVAPEMQNWTKFFRYSHDIILPTRLNNGPSRLFILDTGAQHAVISTEAAHDVTSLREEDRLTVKGLNGAVKDVQVADAVTLEFANVREPVVGMVAFDTSHLGGGSGVEISGLIGFDMVHKLVIDIDYRDDLINFTVKR